MVTKVYRAPKGFEVHVVIKGSKGSRDVKASRDHRGWPVKMAPMAIKVDRVFKDRKV